MNTIVAPSAPQATDNSNFGGQTAAQMATVAAATKTQPAAPIAPVTAPAITDTTKTTTPTEPTVLSSTNISDNVIPANTAAAADLNSKGTYIGQDGNTYHQDGTMAWTGHVADGTQAPGIDNPENDPEINQLNNELGGAKALSDTSTKQSLDATHQMYAARVAMQQDINKRVLQATGQKEQNSGASRYAQNDASGIMTATERAGLTAVGNLEAQETAAIAKVNAAQAKGDQQAMNSAIKEAQTIRKQKQTAADKLQATVQKNNDAIAKTHTQALRDSAITGVIQSGITDPGKLLNTLNKNADGTDNGNNYTLKEINSALGALKPKNTTNTDLYKFTNAETGKLFAAGFDGPTIQKIADDLNGRSDGTTIKGLTPQQQSALNGIMAPQKVANSKPLTSGSMTYTNNDLGKTNQWLSATKGDDGYVDPTAYQKAFDAWTHDGGLAKDFLAKFPPKQWVNPSNDWLPKYLSSKTTTASPSSADLASQINALFPSGK